MDNKYVEEGLETSGFNWTIVNENPSFFITVYFFYLNLNMLCIFIEKIQLELAWNASLCFMEN